MLEVAPAALGLIQRLVALGEVSGAEALVGVRSRNLPSSLVSRATAARSIRTLLVMASSSRRAPHDGVRESNTLLLERYFGWHGLLIEPIPELARQCRVNRPNAMVLEAALARIVHEPA